MTVADWDLIIRDAAMVITTVVIPLAVLAYQRRTGVQVTDRQITQINAAAHTAAGIIQTMIDQRQLSRDDIHQDQPEIVSQAVAAIRSVNTSAVQNRMTVDNMARKIVAIVGPTPKPVAAPAI